VSPTTGWSTPGPAELTVVRAAVLSENCATWLTIIDAAYRGLDATPSPDFVPESSSFRLRSITSLPIVQVLASLSDEVLDQFGSGSRLTIDADQC